MNQTLRSAFLGSCLVLALSLSAPGSACAHEYFTQGFTVIHPWAEPTGPGELCAPVYFKLDNVVAADRLLRAVSPHAEVVELRGDGNASAPALSAIDVVPGDASDFSADRPHLLMKGLGVPLQWGRSYPMTLMFEKAGPVQVMVSVGAH
jgi:copper(I)-binding protein